MVIMLFNEAPKLSQKFAGGKAQRVHMRQTLKFGGLPGSSPAAEVAELDEGGKHLHYETKSTR
jgi:hypothetical protein